MKFEKMEELKILYKEQQKAMKQRNYFELNNINKKIYEIREKLKQIKAKERQIEQDRQTERKIEIILNK